MNEATLKAMGVGPDPIKKLYLSKGFTMTRYTGFVNYLGSVKVPGCADYVATASDADTEQEADFYVESAAMLSELHKASPVASILPDSRAVVAKTKDGRAVALLPVDWISWTAAFEKALGEVEKRAKAELGAQKLEMRLEGRMSAVAKKEIAARGWNVVENLTSTAEKVLASKSAPKK